jgi:hypothetical protein
MAKEISLRCGYDYMYCSDIRTTPLVFLLRFQLGYRIQIFEYWFRCVFCIVSVFNVALSLKKEPVALTLNADSNLLVYTVS